jgi:hypothetical protein
MEAYEAHGILPWEIGIFEASKYARTILLWL